MARLLEAETQPSDTVARYAGQRFALVLFDGNVRQAGDLVERIRQTVEAASFYHLEMEIRITLSGAVVEADAESTPQTLLARAEATLQEAKRYGRNRTFAHEGTYPTPVVPPGLSVEEKRITL
jgi:diguanylate cyclase (GGDEF)-like protein